MSLKKLQILVLAFLISVCSAGCGKAGPSASSVYGAYYLASEKIVSACGLYKSSDGGEPSGFLRGMLRDLDGDGIEELLCFYRKQNDDISRVEVFRYKDGKAVPVLDIKAGEGYGSGDGSSGLYLNTVDGKTVILVDKGKRFLQHMYAYALVNGVLMHTEFYAETAPANEATGQVNISLCSVNGKESDTESYVSQYYRYCSGMQSFLFDSQKDRNCTLSDAQEFLDSLRAKASPQEKLA